MEKTIMATEKQIAANRRNAKKSTGPRTKLGKTIASRNAQKHGLTAQTTVIHSESQAEFDIHRDHLLTDLKPVGPMESILAMRIVDLTWRLRRAKRFRTAAINTMNKNNVPSPLTKLTESMKRRALGQSPPTDDPHVSKEDLELGRLIIKDFSNERVIDHLSLHERRIENSLYKTNHEFHRLQFIRQMNPSDLLEEAQEFQPDRLLCKTNPILKIHN